MNDNQFNKEKALDELAAFMALPPNATISETLKTMLRAQNFLQKLHNDAFEAGFEKGCEATRKVDEL